MKSGALTVTAVLTALVFTPLASVAHANNPVEVVNIPVPKATIAAAFNTAFASMKLRVHNYGAKQGSGSQISWLNNASFVLLPGGMKKGFAVPEEVFYVPGTNKTRRLKYYINDLNTQSIQAGINGSKINITASFESQGEEIKAKCIRRLAGKWKECSLNIERDLHLDNAQIGVSFTPVAYKGSVSYASIKQGQDVLFKYDLRISNKLCQAFKGICGWIENKIKGKLTPAIKNAFAAQINQTAVRDKVADAVRSSAAMSGLIHPSWKVTNITSSGSNFIVRVERPIKIDGTSVKSLSLAPLQSTMTTSCPANVKLKATIQMKHPVNGTGYLVYENGQKSNIFNWSAKQGQTVSSIVTRSFTGQVGATKGGWAIMHVQWKGSDGKTYAKTSNKASFSVSCTPAIGGGGLKL